MNKAKINAVNEIKDAIEIDMSDSGPSNDPNIPIVDVDSSDETSGTSDVGEER